MYRSYRNESALKSLHDLYKINSPFFESGYGHCSICVWGNDYRKYHNNGMDIKTNDDGVKLKGSLLYPYIGAFFIPWNKLNFIGKEKGFLLSKNAIFGIDNSGFFISFPEEYKTKSR